MYPPSITSVSPSSARTGEEITITGLRFGPTKELATVKLNGIACVINAWSNTSISCNVPHTSSGTLVVTTRTNNVVDYGALGDGATDDTAAIQDAIDDLPSNGSALYFPAGTYIVKAPAIETYAILHLADTNIKVCGDGVGVSTIRVADACPTYWWLLGPDVTDPDLSGLEICDLTFDHNIANNPITNEAEILAWPEFTCGTYDVVSNVNIHDIEIINASSLNNIVIRGTGSGHQIKNVTASVIGDDPNHIEHDASFVYVMTAGCDVDNVNLSAVVDALATTCGIEMHAEDYTVRNCTVSDFRIGMNLAGIAPWACGGLVTRNTVTGCSTGIYLWSYEYAGHTTGYGINGLTISENDITLAYMASYLTDSPTGIAFHTDWTHGTLGALDANDIHITDNVITAPLETVYGGYTDEGCGIGRVYLNEDFPMTTLSNCTISGNAITNFPLCGIRFMCNLDNISVTGNTLTNCGSTISGIQFSAHTPMAIDYNTNVDIDTVDISDNIFTDDIAVTLIRSWHFLAVGGTSTGLTITGNSYTMTGDKVVFVRQHWVYDDIVRPVINETILDFVPPLHKVISPGTSIIDGATVWTVGVDELTWTQT